MSTTRGISRLGGLAIVAVCYLSGTSNRESVSAFAFAVTETFFCAVQSHVFSIVLMSSQRYLVCQTIQSGSDWELDEIERCKYLILDTSIDRETRRWSAKDVLDGWSDYTSSDVLRGLITSVLNQSVSRLRDLSLGIADVNKGRKS